MEKIEQKIINVKDYTHEDVMRAGTLAYEVVDEDAHKSEFFNNLLSFLEFSTGKTVIKCKHCGTFVFSRYWGEFATCKCGKVSIDETEEYCRFIADSEDDYDIF